MKRKNNMLSKTFKRTIQYSLEDVNFKTIREEYIAIDACAKMFNDRLKQLKKDIKEDIAEHHEDFYLVESDVKEHIVKAHTRTSLKLIAK
jgi:hypothetical protein